MLYSVPYFMGRPVADLEVPAPHTPITPELPDGSEMERMAALYARLADHVAGSADIPVVYAGDCCVILGMIAGLQRAGIDPVVVFYDAHGDFNTWETTPSGFIGGMPLAMATGRGDMEIAAACRLRVVPEPDIYLVDGRDLDPAESAALAESDVKIVPVAGAASALPVDRPLYIHMDVDVVDPTDLPAVSYPAPGGPSLDAVARSVETVAATGRVVAYSATCWNPALPGAEISAAATHRLSAPFLP